MCRCDFGQQLVFIAGNAGSYHHNRVALAYKPRFGPDISFSLVARERRMNIDGKREALSVFPDNLTSNRKDRGGNISQPHHRARLNRAKGIENARGNRHPADDAIRSSFLNEKFDIPGSSGGVDMILQVTHKILF